jgi:hypothetical protein
VEVLVMSDHPSRFTKKSKIVVFLEDSADLL